MNKTYGEVLKQSINKLKQAGVGSYVLDAQLILAYILGVDKLHILTNPCGVVTKEQEEQINKLIKKRERRVPLQYIIGECEFMSLPFKVTPFTLIPRADTEVLVETSLEILKGIKNPKVLEIGTGSGCVAISIAYFNRDARVTAIDISEGAIDVAKENAKLNNVQERVNFVVQDVFKDFNGCYDMIVSNPPYIEEKEISELQPEVRLFEPMSALLGGRDGLDFYRRIAKITPQLLQPNGFVALELGHTQYKDVEAIFRDLGRFINFTPHYDLAGIKRVILFQP